VGVINNVFKPNSVQKHTRIRVILTYDSEAWTVYKSEESRITAAEMNLMRQTAGYTCMDYKEIQI
jgi:hypothetical protein